MPGAVVVMATVSFCRADSACQHEENLALAVPVVFLVLPVTVLFALFPGLIAIVSLAR